MLMEIFYLVYTCQNGPVLNLFEFDYFIYDIWIMSISIYVAYLYNLNTMLYIYGLYIYTCFKDITAFPCAKLLIVPKDMARLG